jgi:hypothetical protein
MRVTFVIVALQLISNAFEDSYALTSRFGAYFREMYISIKDCRSPLPFHLVLVHLRHT